MSAISIRNLVKQYDKNEVLHGINLEIRDGEFVALVGPSGCGKSTLLRAVAGLEEISEGEIILGNRNITATAPKDRNVAMVFQNYALYPHMTIEQNLAFSLNLHHVDKVQVRQRVSEVARVLGLSDLLQRFPRQLSGGQRQRVAMGRAIVRQPEAFLFDEPLSNLDAQLRVQMRTEIRALHQRLGTTTIYVTHDQVEAMTMADRIVVLKDGVIEQIGTPLELYDRPANTFVAGFIGSPSMNFIPGRIDLDGAPKVITDDGLHLPIAQGIRGDHGRRVIYGARPEHFQLSDGLENPAEVIVVEPTGSETQIAARLGRQHVIAAFRSRLTAKSGEHIGLLPIAEHAHLFDEQSGARLR